MPMLMSSVVRYLKTYGMATSSMPFAEPQERHSNVRLLERVETIFVHIGDTNDPHNRHTYA